MADESALTRELSPFGAVMMGLGSIVGTGVFVSIGIAAAIAGPAVVIAVAVGGALVATLGIFLPSFVFVSLLNPLVPKLRDSAWLSAFLDAVNVSAVALMAAVTVELGAGVLTAWAAWVIAAPAAAGSLFFRLNAAWLVLGGALLGGLFRLGGVGL